LHGRPRFSGAEICCEHSDSSTDLSKVVVLYSSTARYVPPASSGQGTTGFKLEDVDSGKESSPEEQREKLQVVQKHTTHSAE
jgi:hypothetical protein